MQIETQYRKSRKSDNCIIDVHRASYAKHLRYKTHLENFGKQDMIIPEWLFMQPIEKTTKIKEPQAFRTNCQRKF